jgi:hypothetical protein
MVADCYGTCTHFLTGACIGRAGLNRKTAYATLAAVLAAEAADIDVLWGLRWAGRRAEAPSRHHAYVHRRAGGGGCCGGLGVADRLVQARRRAGWRRYPLLMNRRRLRVVVSHPFRRKTGKDAPSFRCAGPESRCIWGWLYLTALICRAEPSAAGLDEQLRPAAIFPLQSALVCGQLCLISPSR